MHVTERSDMNQEDQNVHVIQPEPQGLADEGERIPGIVEAVQNDGRMWGLIRR